MEKDTILVCHGNVIQVVTMMGEPKLSKKVVSQLSFDFTIESIGELWRWLLEEKGRFYLFGSLQFAYRTVCWHSTSMVCRGGRLEMGT